MNWDDARFVLAIHRQKSLSAAAASLGVTRTTVGRRLKATEDELGVRLFDRSDDGLVPTPSGDELAATAARMEAEVNGAENKLLGRDAELEGRLRVSTVDFVFSGFPEILGAFVKRYPRVELTVGITNEAVSLQRREADVALRLGNAPAEGLFGRKVATLYFEAYASRALARQIGKGKPLSAWPWLHLDERSDTRWYDGWLAKHAPGARITMRCNDFEARRRAILAGIGVSFLPSFDGNSHPDLVPLGAHLMKEARELWVLTLPELRHNSRIRAFMTHVAEAFKRVEHRLGPSRDREKWHASRASR
ncbi:MAG: LysR family transcriptional regulator [Archangium sp.]